MSVEVPTLEESDTPSAMEAAHNAVMELVADAELEAAFVQSGSISIALEENGDLTVSAGEVSRTIPAATAMGEAEEQALMEETEGE